MPQIINDSGNTHSSLRGKVYQCQGATLAMDGSEPVVLKEARTGVGHQTDTKKCWHCPKCRQHHYVISSGRGDDMEVGTAY